MDAEQLLDGVRQCVADVLLIRDLDSIRLESSLVGDLGADSLDFLDLVFQLEERFGIKISRGEVNLFQSLELPEEEAHKDGVLTPLALERLARLMPEVAAGTFVPGLTVASVPRLLTVQTFVDIVRRKLEEKSRAAGG
jgi:acyl carrier protein